MRRGGLVLRGILVTICAFGPLTPWLTVSPGLAAWDAGKGVGELYDLRTDFSQAEDLASKDPKRQASMKALSLKEPKRTRCLPSARASWTRIHPEDRRGSRPRLAGIARLR